MTKIYYVALQRLTCNSRTSFKVTGSKVTITWPTHQGPSVYLVGYIWSRCFSVIHGQFLVFDILPLGRVKESKMPKNRYNFASLLNIYSQKLLVSVAFAHDPPLTKRSAVLAVLEITLHTFILGSRSVPLSPFTFLITLKKSTKYPALKYTQRVTPYNSQTLNTLYCSQKFAKYSYILRHNISPLTWNKNNMQSTTTDFAPAVAIWRTGRTICVVSDSGPFALL